MADEDFSLELKQVQALKSKVKAGTIDTGVVKRTRPYRISTVQEMVAMEVLFERDSGLDGNKLEFVGNPWGFPFMPVPNYAAYGDGSAGTRLAPKNISYHWLGHPIYWVDPVLTAMTDDEKKDPARWVVRMTYLLSGFGLYTMDDESQRFHWVNALKAKGVHYTTEEWDEYRRGFEVPQITSVLYTKSDLKMPLEKIEEYVAIAMRRIADITKSFVGHYNNERKKAYETASQYFGSGGKQKTILRLIQEASDLTRTMLEGNSTEDTVETIYSHLREVLGTVREMDRCSYMLKPFVLREIVANQLQFAFVATAMANHAANRRDGDIPAKLRDAAEKLSSFEPGVSDQKDAESYTRQVHLTINESYNDLRLAVANTLRINDGLEPYKNIHELDASNLVDKNK